MRDKPRYKIPDEDRLTRSAVHYLERYASSQDNLKKVLERKVFRACKALDLDPEPFNGMISKVVEKCARAGLVDDVAYAETKAASLRRKGTSRRKLEAYLSAKGIDKSVIETVAASGSDEEARAAQAYAKRRRLGPFREPVKRHERRDKDLAAMCRAGFSYELSRRVIDADLVDGVILMP